MKSVLHAGKITEIRPRKVSCVAVNVTIGDNYSRIRQNIPVTTHYKQYGNAIRNNYKGVI